MEIPHRPPAPLGLQCLVSRGPQEDPHRSAEPVAARPPPYNLRYAPVSGWLNSEVPATEVARRAGHGVAVLLKGGTVGMPLPPARPCPCAPLSVRRTAPETRNYGHIADGGGPKSHLETHKRRSAACASAGSSGL
jgi:hypothetical protein